MAFVPAAPPEGPLPSGHYILVGAAHPHTAGVPMFNAALVEALRRAGGCDYLSWRRIYPPLIYRGDPFGDADPPVRACANERVLDWHRPSTWSAVAQRSIERPAQAVILPWLHPVMTPPYLGIMRRAPALRRVVICHNVRLHEPVRFGDALTRRVLGKADLLVVHTPEQVPELEELGLGHLPRLEAFLPRLSAADLAPLPSEEQVAAEQARQGGGLRLLCFGAVRPYKGVTWPSRRSPPVPISTSASWSPGRSGAAPTSSRPWRGGWASPTGSSSETDMCPRGRPRC